MNSNDRQLLGVLTENLEANGKQNVFINRGSSIQYMVKPIMLPVESTNYYTGYISSFEADCDIEDDEYLPEDSRIDNFLESVRDKLFVFSYRATSEGEFNKLSKVSLVPKPNAFDNNTLFYAIPVFAAANDALINAWEDEHRWKLYRDYNNLGEFTEIIKSKKSVGSLYGYSADEFNPSFVVWRSSDGKLYAIGNIVSSHTNTLGGLILEGNDIFKIDISDYIKFIVYNIDVNPTLSFIPDSIYKKIEDEILKAAMSIEKKENDNLDIEENVIEQDNIHDSNTDRKEINQSIVEINKPSSEELLEIDSSIKNDELIIQSMDYHSQKRNLFYSIRDFVNVHTAIKCSNLVILSGLSGTGKSALVDIYARAIGINYSAANPDENRLLFIPVRPSWNDDADLLGYVDLVHMVYRASDTGFVDFLVKAQKEENKNKMFIVCFDEMNLARVEHYFSQFLSILERPVNQRELQLYDDQYTGRLYNSADYPSRIKIGDNIRFIGTVNIDESTYHFSDKVLDRANVIQLDVLNYANQWVRKQYGTLANINWSYEDYNNLIVKVADSNMSDIHELIWDIHQLMQSASTKYGVGPRIVKAIETYIINLPKSSIGEFNSRIGLDYQIMQRVLTKVRGPESQLGNILKESGENNFYKIFDKYKKLSDFSKCRSVVEQKQKELETYGYCV
ncbi:McrB family protein [Roseburia sp. 499]|uniref:McrB family protein n=1 Tax=Roseburia sp. 499 TaxID=1261634 RepID=UPI000953026E|nr:hypothetical protein [Roseburia sp. 499]WVK70214.1 hypothetical protein BIV20_01415 [Roseburia sp. 499]